MDRKEWLKEQISSADQRYYADNAPAVDDLIYDEWKEELRSILDKDGIGVESEPLLNNVGASTVDNLLEKAEHQTFMGSLDNSMTEQDFRAFNKRVGGPYYCNAKIDGASLALYYVNGKLIKAVTRGDGLVGDDITANVVKFRNLPVQAGYFTGAVRGEAILFTKDWENIDVDQLSNPRNIGSGIIQRSDGKNCELMRLITFDINPKGLELQTELEKEQLLTSLGFEVRAGVICDGVESVIAAHALIEKNRKSIPFWIDGFVVKVNSLARQEELGISGKRPRSQTAFKFTAEKVKTTLESVVWTVGHNGDQIPTAQLKAVRLGGTTVQNALLCNMDEIDRLDIAVGDDVLVYKAGEIIPKIHSVVGRPVNRTKIEEPKVCFACGAETRRRASSVKDNIKVGAVTECSNPDCSAKSTGKLKTFIKKVDILGIGDAILDAMVSTGMVRTIPDLYRLDIDNLSNLVAGTLVGKRRAGSIINEIESKRKLTIDLFIGSLGIQHLGRRRVQLIRESVFAKANTDIFNRLSAWLDGKLIEYREQAGVPGIAEAIQVGINRQRGMIDDLLKEVTIMDVVKKAGPVNGVLGGRGFCLTGTMSRKRSEIAKDIVAAGGLVFDDVSSKDVTLVQSDPSSSSSKSKKANKLGAAIISEAALNGLVGGGR